MDAGVAAEMVRLGLPVRLVPTATVSAERLTEESFLPAGAEVVLRQTGQGVGQIVAKSLGVNKVTSPTLTVPLP